jgi:hypothetical protein
MEGQAKEALRLLKLALPAEEVARYPPLFDAQV